MMKSADVSLEQIFLEVTEDQEVSTESSAPVAMEGDTVGKEEKAQ